MVGSLAPDAPTAREAECTRYFRMDAESDAGGCALGDQSEDSDGDCGGDEFISSRNGKSEAAWARDQRELEASKLSLMRTKKQQQQVEESVRLLLLRLEELPSQSSGHDGIGLDSTDCDSMACDSVAEHRLVESSSELEQILTGKQPQRIAAVAQLLRKGVNMAGVDPGTSERADEACSPASSPAAKAARIGFARPGAKRSTRPVKSKTCVAEHRPEVASPHLARKSGLGDSKRHSCELLILPPAPLATRPPATPHQAYKNAAGNSIGQGSSEMSSPDNDEGSLSKHRSQFADLDHGSCAALANAGVADTPKSAKNWSTSPPDSAPHFGCESPRKDSSLPQNLPIFLQAPGLSSDLSSQRRQPDRAVINGTLITCMGGTNGEIETENPSHHQHHNVALPHENGTMTQAIPATPQRAGSSSQVQHDPFPSPCDSVAGSDPFSRWPVHQKQSLGPEHVMVGEDWRGWTIQTSADGELFYHHEGTATSQWRAPRELLCILGDWAEAVDDWGNTYWANNLVNMSCWTDPRGTANIFQAAYDGDIFFLQLYIRGKGDLNVIDSSGCTALHYASASSTEGVAAFLLENGARADVPDLAGGRPLHWACRYSHSEAARLLLEARADPDRQDSNGDAPLHLAAAVDCTAALQSLINARASPKQRTWSQGVLRTPSEVAVALGAHGAAGMLRDYEQEIVWQVGQSIAEATPPQDPCFFKPPLSNERGASTRRDPFSGYRSRRDPFSSTLAPHGQVDQESGGAWGYPGTGSQDRPAPVVTTPCRGPLTSHAEEEVLSPAVKVVVRAARPLLRGVQWLANRMIPLDDTRTKCWELGRGAPVLESNGFSRLVATIPRGALEQVVQDIRCFDDPPGFEQRGAASPNAFEHA